MVDPQQLPNTHRHAFSREEKVALVMLIVAGLGGLFFGFRYVGKNLQSPFAFTYSGPQYLTANEQEVAQMNAFKSRDTDSDGLNDYDEIYIYKTSAYLTDSDSDGQNDATEVTNGGDPNCPVGKTCAGGSAAVDATVDQSDTILDSLVEPVEPDLAAAQEQLSALGVGDQTSQEDILNNMTPTQLRALLVSNGAKQDQVDALTDAQLMQLYTEALAENTTSSNSSP